MTTPALKMYRVEVMNHDREPLAVYLQVPAESKSQAVALVMSRMIFEAERVASS